jgi:uncharacterized membrane protein
MTMPDSNSDRTGSPLPPPEVLAKYAKIDPQLMDRFVKLYEEKLAHRRKVELARVANERIGIFCGLMVALSGVAAAVYISMIGHPWSGTVIGVADLAGLVGVFVYGTQANRQARALLSARTVEPRELMAENADKTKKLSAGKRHAAG